MNRRSTSFVLCGLMIAASVTGMVARPSTRASQTAGPRYILADVVPHTFGDWKEATLQPAAVVDPGTQQLLDKLYSQTLVRTYVNTAGYQIMLSLAYGEDQRGNLALHKPEVCYPAQGFKLLSNVESQISTPFGAIAGRRLSTRLGARQEPVTYWVTVGNEAIRSKFAQRLVEIKLGLTGKVPDGLLFRVSSIDPDPNRAYTQQDAFVSQLLSSVTRSNRVRLSGLGG